MNETFVGIFGKCDEYTILSSLPNAFLKFLSSVPIYLPYTVPYCGPWEFLNLIVCQYPNGMSYNNSNIMVVHIGDS